MMIEPASGRMKHSLRFERQSAGGNVGGVPTGGWAVIDGADACPASVAPTQGGEAIIAGRMSGKVSYDIWVHNNAVLRTVTNGDRAVNNRTGEVYNLAQPIDVTGRRRRLFFQATSAGNAEGQG